MLSPFLKRIFIDVALLVALGLGIIYLKQDFIDFLISLFHFEDKINVSSLAYIIQRACLILIPIIMLSERTNIPKNKLISSLYYTIGICYFAGNLWVIFYLIGNSFSIESFSNLFYATTPAWFSSDAAAGAKASLYLFQYNNAYVFNYLNWDSYNLMAIIFSGVMGWLYIRYAKKINGHMKRVCKRYLLLIVLSIIVPWLYNIIFAKTWFFSDLWLSKNSTLILSYVFVFIAMKIASGSRSFWNELFY